MHKTLLFIAIMAILTFSANHSVFAGLDGGGDGGSGGGGGGQSFGSAQGHIRLNDGSPDVGVTVTFRDANGNFITDRITDENGFYALTIEVGTPNFTATPTKPERSFTPASYTGASYLSSNPVILNTWDFAENPLESEIDPGEGTDPDTDNDGVFNDSDNCPNIANANQANSDGDSFGDACDDDIDGDNVSNGNDNCQFTVNTNQLDTDNDGIGDVCDDDIDNDTILNVSDISDNCPLVANQNQANNDDDTLGDACDNDDDNDTVADDIDNCPFAANLNQLDTDNDGIGNACDNFNDTDKDNIQDSNDNCPSIANNDQTDVDNDGVGDACDLDIDGDGVPNAIDNCPNTSILQNGYVNPSTGCSLEQACPCQGPSGSTEKWRNHGDYVSCVAHETNILVNLGILTGKQKGALQSTAGKSSCGK